MEKEWKESLCCSGFLQCVSGIFPPASANGKKRWTRCHDYKKTTHHGSKWWFTAQCCFQVHFLFIKHPLPGILKEMIVGLWNSFSLIKWSKDSQKWIQSIQLQCFIKLLRAGTSQSPYWNDQSSVPKELRVWGKRPLINISTNHLLCPGREETSMMWFRLWKTLTIS